MTRSDEDVDDTLVARIAERFDSDAIVGRTAVIARETASTSFNRALRVPSQGRWQQSDAQHKR